MFSSLIQYFAQVNGWMIDLTGEGRVGQGLLQGGKWEKIHRGAKTTVPLST
jgi:hypothetical protein